MTHLSEAVSAQDRDVALVSGKVPEVVLAIGAGGLEIVQSLQVPGCRIVQAPLLIGRGTRPAERARGATPDAVLVHSQADMRQIGDTPPAVVHVMGDLIAPVAVLAAGRMRACVALLLEAPLAPGDVTATGKLVRHLATQDPGLVFLAVPDLYFALAPLLTRGEQLIQVADVTAALAQAGTALVPVPCDGARVPVIEALAAGLVPLSLVAEGDDLDPRCRRLADPAALAAALRTPDGTPDGTAAAAPIKDPDGFAAALKAFRTAVGAKAGGRVDDAQFAQNLGVSITPLRQTLNPWTRLLWREFEMTCAAPIAAVSAEFAGPVGTALFNDWVWVSAGSEGRVRLKAVVILHSTMKPEDLVVEVRIWGRVVARLETPADIEEETAGLIGLNAGEADKALVEAWAADPALLVQVGKTSVKSEPAAAAAADGPATCRIKARWPFNRETLTTLPKRGVGQKFTDFKGYATARRTSSPRLDRMQGSRAGQTAWLIGNGPSVRLADLDRLAGRTTFGFNRLYLAYGETALRPTYTVTGDPQMIEDFGADIVARSSGEVFVAAYEAPDLTGNYHWVRQARVFPHLFSRDAPRIVTAGGSSLYIAMQIGFWLGIRQFYIYGADFRFAFERNAGADPYRAATGEGNHFIKDYRGGKAWCPPAFETITGAFLAARLLMESEGGFIRNATRGGELDVFDRADFDDALAQD